MNNGCLVLGATLSLSITAWSTTADELVQKNTEAKGGIEKIKAIKTVRLTGKLDAGGGFTGAVGQENKRPNQVRETFTLQGMTQVQAYDGSAGWQIRPFGGRKDPQLMGEDDMRDLLIDADFDGPLVDYVEKGNKIEYLGHDTVDGDDALRLKVTLKNGDIIYYYLDPDTDLEIRKEVQQFVRGSVRERVIDLGSYKPVDGVMYPFSISEGTKSNPGAQVTTVQKIEVNVAFQESDFALPASLRTEEKKSGLVGSLINSSTAPTVTAALRNLNGRGLVHMKVSARNSWEVIVLCAGVLTCAFAAVGQAPVRFDSATVSGWPARQLGLAAMSGRNGAVGD